MNSNFPGGQDALEVQRPPTPPEARQPGGPAIMERDARIGPSGQPQISVIANIVITGGPEDGYIVPISNRGLTIGRLPDNDIVVNEPWVSRKHAEILCIGSQYLLRDLSSSNGTFVTDRPIGGANHPLEDGDQIRFGRSEVQLIFRFSGAVTLKMGKEATLPSEQAQRQPVIQADAAQNTLASIEPVPSAQPQPEAPPNTSIQANEQLVEGDIRLNVSAGGDMRRMFQFVHELRKNSRLRVLRLARGAHQDIAIWLGLREPVPLKSLLSAMNCVSGVKTSDSGDSASGRVFDIALSA